MTALGGRGVVEEAGKKGSGSSSRGEGGGGGGRHSKIIRLAVQLI